MGAARKAQIDGESVAIIWMRGQPLAAKLTALELLYLAMIRQTEGVATQLMREFLEEIEQVVRDQEAPVTLEERTLVGYVLGLRDLLIAQEQEGPQA